MMRPGIVTRQDLPVERARARVITAVGTMMNEGRDIGRSAADYTIASSDRIDVKAYKTRDKPDAPTLSLSPSLTLASAKVHVEETPSRERERSDGSSLAVTSNAEGQSCLDQK